MDLLLLMKNELWVTGLIFLLLVLKLGKDRPNGQVLPWMQLLLLLNLLWGFCYLRTGNLFDGLYVQTSVTILEKNILNLAVYLVSLLFTDWLKKNPNMVEFLLLMLAALLGMYFLISSGHLLIFFLGLELSTIPVAAMVNFEPDRKSSSEGAMKMILSSAFSSGLMLFGISLLYGLTGSVRFDELPQRLHTGPFMITAFVFFFSGFAFKLSIVPFHLWTADVYEGGPISTSSFLSVLSKGAVAFALVSVLYRVFFPLVSSWYSLVVLLAFLTMLVGNLFALRQRNIKRFLAFSSITQVGFLLVGLSSNAPEGEASILYFILVYTFSNLAAFGVASLIASATGKENIDDYRGLRQTNPLLAWTLAIALISLAGVPPTAGFFGKLFLLSAGAMTKNNWLILIAAINMIISLYYYLRIVRLLFMDSQTGGMPVISSNAPARLGLSICVAGILLTGVMSWVYEWIRSLVA